MAKKFLPLLLSFFSLVSILVAVPPMWEWRTGYEESSKRTTPTVYSSISPSTEPLVDEFTESRTESCSGPSGDLSPERVRRGSGIFKSIPKLHVTDDHDADDALEESTISRQELLDQSEAFVKDCFIGEREEAIKKFEELSSLKNTLCNEICNNTENLLKKIDDVKIKSEEAIHLWEEAVENTQMIRTIFEGYKAVCEKMQDPSEAEKISEQIQFYEAKLLEYEAESQAAETLHHARSNQSSQSSASIQTSSDSNKNELTRNFFMATVNFEKAAAAYREMKKGDEDGEVADFYSLMARWCDARALEQQIFSQLHCAEIYNQHYAFTDLEKSVEKLFVAYNDFVSHCEILSDELSNEPLFQEEKNEVDKYCAAAVKRRAGLIDSVQISEKAFHQDCALYAALRHGLLF